MDNFLLTQDTRIEIGQPLGDSTVSMISHYTMDYTGNIDFVKMETGDVPIYANWQTARLNEQRRHLLSRRIGYATVSAMVADFKARGFGAFSVVFMTKTRSTVLVY